MNDSFGEHPDLDDPRLIAEIRAAARRQTVTLTPAQTIARLQEIIASLRADIDAHECGSPRGGTVNAPAGDDDDHE